MSFMALRNTGVSPRVNNNAIHRNMPTLVIGVVVIDVPPLCGETMIAFPDGEHLPSEMCKIRILHELGVKFCGGLLPERAPRAIMEGGMGRSTGTSLKADTHRTRSPSRYPIRNSHSKRCTSTSLIGRTRGRAFKRHKERNKRDCPVGLTRR